CRAWYLNNRNRRNEQRRKKRALAGKKSINVVHCEYREVEETIIIPPHVKKAQERRFLFMIRAIAMGHVTPNQYFVGEPVRRGSLRNGTVTSLSATEIHAMLR
ncbi:MAG: hypothetical protein KGJ13_12760, partial [Patescibacteria group bacterium]|nr:hypothetical protein [Patescibacteria group bacterium]